MLSPVNLVYLKLAVKTGLAAVLSYYLAHFLGLSESYWAAITAIIVMYSDTGKTLKASRDRVIGTAIGVAIGAVFAIIFGQQLWAFGVAVTLTMMACAILGFADAARLAGVAVAIVMLASHAARPWVAAWHRFLEVTFGIVIAVLVSMLLWPDKNKQAA